MEFHLSDGRVFSGRAFGAGREAGGEVVFHTGMAGYVEALTDPSYRGQMLVMTFPSIGNYGIDRATAESAEIQVEGLIVAHAADSRSPVAGGPSLAEWLGGQGVPALAEVDTRSLMRHVRAHGPLDGRLVRPGGAADQRDCTAERPAAHAGDHLVRDREGAVRVLVIDLGVKASLLQGLRRRGAAVWLAPAGAPWERWLGEVDGVLLSNGPGDPAALGALVARLRPLLVADWPILGVCLGHQLLALAAGARTRRLPFGHRAHNHPVHDRLTGRTLVTSQNHGFAVCPETLPAGWTPRFTHLADGTNEGMVHADRPYMGVQFHPEAAAGPRDAEYILDEFLALASRRAALRRP